MFTDDSADYEEENRLSIALKKSGVCGCTAVSDLRN